MAGLVLTWLVLILVCVALYQLFVAYGRLLLRIDALQGQPGGGVTPGPEQAHHEHDMAPPPAPVAWGDQPDPPDYATVAEERTDLRGLGRGLPAPSFRLPRLDGGELVLDAYRGRRVLLTFVDPACASCEALLPSLEAIHGGGGAGLTVLAVSRGERDRNLEMVARHGLTFPVGMQRHWDLSRQYQLLATPVAFLIDERSVIAAEPAIGAEEILRLAA